MSWMLIIYNTTKIIDDDQRRSMKNYIPTATIILNTETIWESDTKMFTSERRNHKKIRQTAIHINIITHRPTVQHLFQFIQPLLFIYRPKRMKG